MIVPTLRVGMPPGTLRVHRSDAERQERHSHAERGNDQTQSEGTIKRKMDGVCAGPFPAKAGPTRGARAASGPGDAPHIAVPRRSWDPSDICFNYPTLSQSHSHSRPLTDDQPA